LRGTASFVVFCVTIGARVSAVAFLKNLPPPKKKPSHFVPRGVKSCMRRTETPKPIWINFCTLVDITDLVNNTNFDDHRLRGFWLALGQIAPFPIDFHRRLYNTLALSCECVIPNDRPVFNRCGPNLANDLQPPACHKVLQRKRGTPDCRRAARQTIHCGEYRLT